MSSATSDTLEYQVKAAFIYKFAKFLKWPTGSHTGPNSPIKIAVLGEGPLTEAVESIQGKEVGERKLMVEHYQRAEDIGPSHVLVIGASEKSRLQTVFDRFKESSTLTVSDIDGFCERGGMINLLLVEGKVRFAINLDVLRESNLDISSKVLRLAIIIQSKDSGEAK